jgi:hypothetical protein
MNETRDEIEQLTRSLNGQKRLFDKMNYEI